MTEDENAPRGTVTFLFTDIEGSTRLWQSYPEAMHQVYFRHDEIVRCATAKHEGLVFKTVGDAFQVAFASAPLAASAAIMAQELLEDEVWPIPERLRVRMALHLGHVVPLPDGDYRSPVLNRLGRLLNAAHGGQILVSAAVATAIRGELAADVQLRDLGARHLKDLGQPESIYQLVSPSLPVAFPPLRTLDRRPQNLPVQPTALIGREREIAAVRTLLERDASARLVTLIGPGGVGKTRLGLQVAAELVDVFDDGTFFVPLAALIDPTLVLTTLANTLGIREEGPEGLLEKVQRYLQDRRTLLLLDNAEHLLPDVASLIAELLAVAPGVRVLVTSRAPLRIRGEREMSVEPLPPSEALQLFIDRAHEIRPSLQVTPESRRTMANICRRLEYLPLAIELAVARVRLLSPDALLPRLERRLPVLVSGARDLPERHRTLRATLAWSYGLLGEPEKAVMRTLAVFAGGCTLEAAEAICAEDMHRTSVLDSLGSLVEQSLLLPEEQRSGDDTPRFVMLETIREFGQELLAEQGEVSAVRARHARYFLRLAEAAELDGPDQSLWLNRLEAEHDNLRRAFAHALEHREAELALRSAAAIWEFWRVRGHISEGRTWLERGLALEAPVSTATLGKATNAAAALAWAGGDLPRAIELQEESLANRREIGDASGIAYALGNLGILIATQGNSNRARDLFEEALAQFESIGDSRGLATALQNLGNVLSQLGEHEQAARLLEKSLALQSELGEGWRTGYVLLNLGYVETALNAVTAKERFQQALDIFERLDHKRGAARASLGLGAIAERAGDHVAASRSYAAALALARETEDPPGVVRALMSLGSIALLRRDDRQAALLLHESVSLAWETDDLRSGTDSLAGLSAATARLGYVERAGSLFGLAEVLAPEEDVPRSEEDLSLRVTSSAVLAEFFKLATFTAARSAAQRLSPQQAQANALTEAGRLVVELASSVE